VRAAAAANPAATVPNTPVNLVADDADEETVVRPRHVTRPQIQPVIPPEPARFNPWRIMVPAAVALVVVFAAVFLLTRGPSQTDQTQGQPLTVDPNSQPVQPAGSPTGQSESDIRSVSLPSPTPASTRPNENASTGAQVPATVTGNFGSNENTNSGRGNRNSNQPSEPPPPRITATPDAPPPPKPSPTVRTLPKSTPATTPGQP
jgi:hypothetical protein